MTQFKLIGFDLDGTLVNSLPDLALSINSALKDVNLPQASENLVMTWIGNGADVLSQRAVDWACTQAEKELTEDEFKYFKRQFGFYYGENLCNISRLYPNVKETLEALKAQGYILAVVTNKPTKHVQPILTAFGIDHLFSEMLGDNLYRKLSLIRHLSIIYVASLVCIRNKFFCWRFAK